MKSFLLILAAAVVAVALPAQTANDKGMILMTAANQWVSIADNVDLVPANGFTMEAWFYMNGAVNGDATIIRKSVGFPDTSYLMRIENNGTLLKSYLTINGNAYNYFTATVPFVGNVWHHMATTYDGLVARMYLDGQQVATQNLAGTLTFQPGALVIGRGSGSGEQWIGAIDEVRLWSYARTQSQIQTERFNEIAPQPGLIDMWRFNGGYLASGGGHNGVPMGPIQNVLSTSPVIGAYLVAPPVVGLGSIIAFTIYSAQAGVPYVLDIGITGTSPGIPLPPPSTLTIPLNPPWIFTQYGQAFPAGTFNNFLGVVPATHQAIATLDLPTDPALVGITISSAFVLLDGAAPSGVGVVSLPKQTVIGNIAPLVLSVSPPTAPVAGGTQMTVTGTWFQPGATVKVDGTPATNVVVVDGQHITCTVPPGLLGPADVRVTNPDTLFHELPAAMTYVPTLVLSSISPTLASPGATVTIAGAGFAPGLQVSISGTPVPTTNVLPGAVTFQSPPTVPCNAIVQVVNPDQQSGQLPWNPSPVITQIFNNNGSAGGGGSMFLLGSFTPGTTVTIAGIPATVTFTPTALLVTAPGGPLGFQPVVVTATNGCTTTTTYYYH